LSKPDVLFLHGAGGGGWEWNIWVRVFKAHGFKVHAPDFVPSVNGLADTSLEDYSLQVQQHLLTVPSPKILIGASLGGLLALMNAGHVEAMVLINPLPPAPFHQTLPIREKYPAIIPWASKAQLENTRRAIPDADALSCLYAFRRWRDESGLVLNTAYAGVPLDLPSCPMLVMASELDEDIPLSTSQALAKVMKSEFVSFAKTSHVGALIGKNANHFAVQTVAWLNGICLQR
jgi:pimeloyl-ACP methyl ester carboxylesterase